MNTTMAMAISGDLAVSMDPTVDGSFSSASTTITVATNNQTGYNLSVMSNDDTTAMTHSSATISDKIVSTASALTSANMAKNTWGYTTASSISSSTTFNPIPTKGHAVEIKNTDGPSTSSTQDTKVSIGVKADTSIASGKYSNTLTFSAIANEIPVFDGITTMQQMTTSICNSEPTPSASDIDVPTATLTDTRDGKTYKVSKLADGHCWMSQNLALGGSSPITLTPADSNVTSNWTLPATKNNSTWAGSYTDPEFYYNTANNNYGNYYNWPAATAGSGTRSILSANAPQSICPKGWRLPKGNNNGEFKNLITTTYGITGDATGSTKLQSAPLSFPLSGYYANRLVYQGSSGFYWSSTVHSNTDIAYHLYFDSSSVSPVYGNSLAYGYTVRCIAE